MTKKSKRKALGNNWADAYASPVEKEQNTTTQTKKPSQPKKISKPKTKQKIKAVKIVTTKPENIKQKKVRAVFYLPENLLQEARNSVMHLAGYPEYLNLTKLAENAITNELSKLKKKHMNGEEFPKVVDGPLKGGRPIGT